MASFSVDVTKIVFAGGRTGSKVVTISNAPSGGIGISNTGYGTHFRVVVKEENVSYSIETKATNSSGDSYSSTIRFYNKADSTDYVDITIVQYSAKKIAVYADNLTSTGTSGAYSLNIDYPSGSTDLYIDVEAAPSGFDYRGYAEVTSGEKWLSVAQASTAITDTGFFHYVISYTDNRDASARTGQVRCTGSVVGWENTITVTQEVSPQALTATPLLDIVSSSAGTVTVTVTGAGESDISYRIEGSWVTFDHKSGNDYYFNYTAHPGDTDAGRFALITFSAPGCASVVYELQQTVKMVFSETSESVSNSSGSVSIIFRRPSTLSHINYSISDSWITFDRISGSVMYFNYTANSGSSRTGVITFSESGYDTSTFTLTQGGGAPAASLSISPTSSSVDKEAGSVVITVSSSGISDITYTISDSWIQYFAKTGNKYKFSYNQNNTTSVRQGSITFSGGGISKTFTLTQAAPIKMAISPSSQIVGSSSGTLDITISSSGISDISYSISDSWITYSSKNGSVYTFSYEANKTTSVREGSITFSGGGISKTFKLTQDWETESFYIYPSTNIFNAYGKLAEESYTRLVNAVYPVTAVPSDSWITASVDESNNRVNVTVTENNTSGVDSVRTGSIVITDASGASATYSITQAGDDIMFNPNPVVFNADGSGGPGVVNVYCHSTVYTEDLVHPDSSTIPSWLNIIRTDYAGINGLFYYNITASENTSSSPRSARVLFTEMNGTYSGYLDVTQAAGSASSISVSPSSLSFGPDASYADISLTYGGTHYNTDAQAVYTWVTVNLSDTETGKAAGTVSVASNTTTESRRGNVYFSDELGASIALPIEQAGISFALSANPSTLNIPAKGGSVTTAVTYEGTLSAASLPSWLSETHTDDDANHRTYTVTAASNGPTQERTFNWRLDDNYNNCWVYISQAAAEVPSMVISPTSSSVSGSSGTVDITVRSTNISDISYSISDSWITYSSKSGSVYTFSYAENNTASVRQGSITFSGGGISKTFNLTQEGQGGSDPLSVTPTELNFTASGDTKSVTVSGGTGTIAVNTGSFPSWLSITSVGNGVYNITASKNSGVSRSFDVWFTDEASTTVIVNVSQDASSVKLTVSPSSKSFGSAGGSQVFRVTYNTRINYNTLPSWLSIVSGTTAGSTIEYTMTASENTDTSSRNFNWVLTDELTTVTVPISQSGTSGPGPGPEPVEEGSLKVYPKKLRYYSDGGRILVSFTNKPEAGIGYSITYTDGSGWLSVEGVSPNMYVSATANDGIRRRAEIKFYDLSDNTNYVIVPVIQGSVEGYNSIWMDDLYYPENRDTSGNYFYRVVNKDTGQTYFTGISSKPLSWTGNIGGIDIPRLVDNYIKSDFVQQNTGEDWADMHSGYCTVDIYNMANTDGVVDATFKYWNDWSRFERKYDYTRSLNDPINGKGSNNMIIPFCVYYDDEATFTIVDTKKNGNINTYTLSSPSSPFMMRYNSYYDIKKVEYKKDDDVLFSYDMNHCGPGAFIYRNRFGGWDSFLIEGNISKTDNYTKQNYRIKGEYNQEYVINTLKYIDEKRTDSIDIDTTYEASTGWLTDEESERLVFHLLSSPIVYFQNLHKENQLYDTDSLDIIPVRITASSSEYKKFRNGRRLVNYLITFEKCNIEKVRQ